MSDPVLTSGLTSLLPRNVSTKVWDTAVASSIIPTLTTAEPIIIGDNVIPTVTEKPRASMIAEGAAKKASNFKMDSKTLYRGKAVVMAEVSLETTLANPVQVLSLLQASFGAALATQIDLAILHNRDALTGAQVSADATSVLQTTQKVELGTDVDQTRKEINAAGALVAGNSITPNGIAIDPKLQARMIDAVNPLGAELFPGLGFNTASSAPVAGLKPAFGNTVSGLVYPGDTDTRARGIVGNWDAIRWGKALDIRFKKVEYGDPTGNGDLQARNMVAFIGEVIFGWHVLDVSKTFAVLEEPTPEP